MTRTPHNSGRNINGRRRAAILARAVVGAVGITVVGVGGWAGLKAMSRGDSARANVLAVDLAEVRMMDVDITTISTGEIEAKNRIEIRSKLDTESSIIEIIREGTRAAKGQVLVQLNGSTLQEAIEREQIEVEGARADFVAADNDHQNQIEENESSLRKAQLKVTLAQLALDQWIDGELQKQYDQLKLAIERAERDFERQRDKYAKSQELFDQGFLSKNELDLDEIGFIEAVAKYDTAILDEEIYWTYQYPKDREQKQSDVTEAKAELERVARSNEIALVGKRANLESRRRRLTMREDRLAKLQEQLESCRIVAPSAGLVVYSTSMEDYWDMQGRGAMQIGRVVSPNDLIMVLPDVSEMIAKVRVHETLAGRVREGQPASIKVDALGDVVFTGKVQSVGVLAESSNWRDPNRREYTVRIAIDDGPEVDRLKPSMRCETEIRLDRLEQVKAVPVQAVFSDGPVRFVYVPQGGRFARKPVQVGQTSDMYAEVVAGLEPGQRVLLRRPIGGEVIDEPWDPAQLALVGIQLNERGEPVATRREGARGMPSRGPGGESPRNAEQAAVPAATEATPAVGETPAESSGEATPEAATTQSGESTQAATPATDTAQR